MPNLTSPQKTPTNLNLVAGITFGLLFIVIVISVWLNKLANSGASGTEFYGPLMLLPFTVALIAALVTYVVKSIAYLIKERPRGRNLILPLLSLLIGAGLVFWEVHLTVLQDTSWQKYQNNQYMTQQEALRRVQACQVQEMSNTELITAPGTPYYQNRYIHVEDITAVRAAWKQTAAGCGFIVR